IASAGCAGHCSTSSSIAIASGSRAHARFARTSNRCRRASARAAGGGGPGHEEVRMKIGVGLPQTAIGNEPAAIKSYAEAVESMGFTHILVFDHVLGANPDRPGGFKGPYTYRHAFHEPFVLFGFLAAVTRRVELVTGIIILPQRQTTLVAKQ